MSEKDKSFESFEIIPLPTDLKESELGKIEKNGWGARVNAIKGLISVDPPKSIENYSHAPIDYSGTLDTKLGANIRFRCWEVHIGPQKILSSEGKTESVDWRIPTFVLDSQEEVDRKKELAIEFAGQYGQEIRTAIIEICASQKTIYQGLIE